MMHPGLPAGWVLVILGPMFLVGAWALVMPLPGPAATAVWNPLSIPRLGRWIHHLVTVPWLLLSLRLVMVGLFLLVIVAGLFGTPIPERNLAVVLTWNLWWTGLIFSVFAFGSAWCALCPWDALAQWLVRRRLWRRAQPNNSLNLRLPKRLRNLWPALFLFIGLTWLELGAGIVGDPYATALLALAMLFLATASLAVFSRKAFCRYFCPVGRTIGCYSQLAPVELRPIDAGICADCETLQCYHGDDRIEPCPTWLVMGRIEQSSDCTCCGNCAQSCPQRNVAWRLRLPGAEAIHYARPRWDEAWFVLGLLALTAFHGVTMMPFWEVWMAELAQRIGDSGPMVWSFTLGLLACLVVFAAFYGLCVETTRRLSATRLGYRQVFSTLAFTALPLAFAYHLAHNLNHLLRESANLGSILLNPLGIGTLPPSMAEKHMRMMAMPVPQEVLAAMQAGLMLFGFVIAVQILRRRGHRLLQAPRHTGSWRLAPVMLFVGIVTGFHLWLLMQPMVMRM